MTAKKQQELLLVRGQPTEGKVMLIGDSIINNVFKYRENRCVWEAEFGDSYLNYGVGGDCIKNVLWRIEFHKYTPAICDTVIIQVGTNITNRRCKLEILLMEWCKL